MVKEDIRKVPVHLGFILDGNRRWAKSKGLPQLEGHRRGFNRLTELVDNCIKKGVKNVTVFAFSTENWNRSKEEVDYLMNLFREMLDKTAQKLHEKDVRVRVVGRIEDFASDIQKKMQEVMEKTKNNSTLTFNIGLSYGGRAEIVDATKRIIKDGLRPEDITEEKFAEYIYEVGQPDPDVIVRTSGEQRISGFMLWQAAYSEFYFTDVCWPDFDEKELDRVIDDFNQRERRFGK
ncbi:MAG: polyprenyl diphosphate synthase [Patescibacteria group bacterium]|nr:polyprenyl diphosphate synthase [Patescibacteria group bacterium]